MTIEEEKAKAYDKAIEKIKYVLGHGVSPVLNKEDLQDIFPELKESEDEKVRKEIVRFIQMEVEDEIVGNKWLAWLEKQGEKKSQRMISAEAKEAMYDKPTWSEDDEKIITGIINDIQKRLEDYPLEQLAEIYFKEIDWLKSLKQRIGG